MHTADRMKIQNYTKRKYNCSQSSSTDVRFGTSKIIHFVCLKGAEEKKMKAKIKGKERYGENEYIARVKKSIMLYISLEKNNFLNSYPTHFLEGLPGARNTREETFPSGVSLKKNSVRCISFLYTPEISTLNIH